MALDVLLHLGTLIPVIIVFWKDIFPLIKKPFQKKTYLLVVATIPAVIVTLLLGDLIDNFFAGGLSLGIGFLITGTVLLISDKIEDGYKEYKDVSYLDAGIIGIIQAIAIMPGISRSGSTITGGLFRKLDRETAASFSFLLSIPAILGGAVLQIVKIIKGHLSFSELFTIPNLAGFVAAAIFGYIAIRFMLRLIQNKKLKYFSYYVYALGIIIIIDHFFLNMIF